MASAAKTPKLLLPQWTTAEKPERTDFNDAFLKIDNFTLGGASNPFTAMPFVGSAPVFESGSNANGNYVKFVDGTMICVKTVTIAGVTLSALNVFGSTSGTSYYGYVGWIYPVAFYSMPIVLTDVPYAIYIGLVSKTRDKTVSGVTVCAGGTTYNNVTVDCLAFGRWKA